MGKKDIMKKQCYWKLNLYLNLYFLTTISLINYKSKYILILNLNSLIKSKIHFQLHSNLSHITFKVFLFIFINPYYKFNNFLFYKII
jgi:uncharacterized membrane protein